MQFTLKKVLKVIVYAVFAITAFLLSWVFSIRTNDHKLASNVQSFVGIPTAYADVPAGGGAEYGAGGDSGDSGDSGGGCGDGDDSN